MIKPPPTFRLEFLHVGSQCPACGYVFTNGFSSMMVDGEVEHPDGALTLCTRCYRPLAVTAERVKVLDDVGLMLLTNAAKEQLDTVRKLLAWHNRGRS